ncbi:universal stress protein [Desulfurivibrio alkaliphilus]|uniref:UspA domain protein n=1 Tax=Desulfurivibrio alkaliphilus (strain DSM 19089 / UNIQEM U267 / AHT2) TaxID=589865 RepID=D6Z3E9_DESAT|nr:universal stress protein [Desulfurivibrio alkaliphilus]ADH86074.1 UspA domain protein [Desulfurivibrio alkaliphilus AHT 2]
MNTDSVSGAGHKLLVAIDGSIHSRNALHYLAGLFAARPEVHFKLFSLVPGVHLPPGSEWLSEAERVNMLSPTARQKLVSHKGFLHQAAGFLAAKGVAPERIEEEVKISGGNLAADIAAEARRGMFDALVVGRRGMTKLEELLLGGVSVSLLEKCHDIPQWIIDGKIDSHRFLVPVDGSPYALLAVDHLAFMLHEHPTAEITLFHSTAILAERPQSWPEDCYRRWGREWCTMHLEQADNIFHAPRRILSEAGFPAQRIHELETSKGFEPSRQIVRQALIDGYGTIVLGRRGAEAKKGLFRGVSDRVLLMAEQVAVWVVG